MLRTETSVPWSRRKLRVLWVAVLGLAGFGTSTLSRALAPGVQAATSTPETGGPKSPAEVLAGSGVDVASLSPTAQRELANVLSDEFCYCGCPHTLGVCLKTHRTCQHARRMAALAAKDASAGGPAAEIILRLSKYYLSFREPRQSFRIDERMCLGSKEAKVTLLEFSDFECPHCAAVRPILEKFARDKASVARLCFAPFPLSSHPNATPAALAASLARDKGKFWEMHDLLFENQTRLSPDFIRTLGTKVNLSPGEVAKALDSPKYAAELEEWKAAGRKAGVDATPTLYVNGRKLNLGLSHEVLERTVEDELEWVSHNGRWAPD